MKKLTFTKERPTYMFNKGQCNKGVHERNQQIGGIPKKSVVAGRSGQISSSDLALSEVSKFYRQDDTTVAALRDCTLNIDSGDFFSIVGPSGTGKTTLLNLVAGFEKPDLGSVRVGGSTVSGPGRDRAIVFQSPTLFPWLSALDNIADALRAIGIDKKERRLSAMSQLGEVGLAESASKRPYKMSGGMQQRVGIARALIMQPKVLIMDEPFAALDFYVRQEMQNLIVDVWRRHEITTLFVTHSIEEALLVSTKIGIMSGGTVSEIFDIDSDHPRDPTSAQFNDLRREISRHIEMGVRSDRENRQ